MLELGRTDSFDQHWRLGRSATHLIESNWEISPTRQTIWIWLELQNSFIIHSKLDLRLLTYHQQTTLTTVRNVYPHITFQLCFYFLSAWVSMAHALRTALFVLSLSQLCLVNPSSLLCQVQSAVRPVVLDFPFREGPERRRLQVTELVDSLFNSTETAIIGKFFVSLPHCMFHKHLAPTSSQRQALLPSRLTCESIRAIWHNCFELHRLTGGDRRNRCSQASKVQSSSREIHCSRLHFSDSIRQVTACCRWLAIILNTIHEKFLFCSQLLVSQARQLSHTPQQHNLNVFYRSITFPLHNCAR
jgi:hypothetical protein